MDLSSDEFENKDDYLKLAKESEEELIKRVMNIAYYYKQESNKWCYGL